MSKRPAVMPGRSFPKILTRRVGTSSPGTAVAGGICDALMVPLRYPAGEPDRTGVRGSDQRVPPSARGAPRGSGARTAPADRYRVVSGPRPGRSMRRVTPPTPLPLGSPTRQRRVRRGRIPGPVAPSRPPRASPIRCATAMSRVFWVILPGRARVAPRGTCRAAARPAPPPPRSPRAARRQPRPHGGEKPALPSRLPRRKSQLKAEPMERRAARPARFRASRREGPSTHCAAHTGVP